MLVISFIHLLFKLFHHYMLHQYQAKVFNICYIHQYHALFFIITCYINTMLYFSSLYATSIHVYPVSPQTARSTLFHARQIVEGGHCGGLSQVYHQQMWSLGCFGLPIR